MARIRAVEIKHFRGIKELVWHPSPGINCLIGPGDSGKSTILDAIDFCLGPRRNIQFTDADFHRLDVETPITITVTLGELDDGLKNLDAYGMFVRSFDAATENIEDEPEKDAETVLSLRLTVASDLEPSWTLVSERAEAQGFDRNLSWGDRVRLAPTRIGALADYHLGWRRGSVLNRVSEERADASAALVKAARDARAAFSEEAQGQLGETLGIVTTTAKELGIPIGENIKAMLDAHSVSFSGGTLSLHDEGGIPLRGLGIGSTRLLIAGLQRKAAAQSTIILIDELEHGLEPHRILRLLASLGAKEKSPPLQVFMTTHSPVALRELSGSQLFVARRSPNGHEVLNMGTSDGVQSTIRLYPDAFLAPSVIICEGASEVGLVRGLDQYRTANGRNAITALGTALVDCGGGDSDRPFARADAFNALGYRTAVVRDDDKRPTTAIEDGFIAKGGKVIAWRDGRALEDELFQSLSDDGVKKLLALAIELHGDALVNEHIRSATKNAKELAAILAEAEAGGITPDSRTALGAAARTKRAGWFKSVTWMEEVARDIVGPDLAHADAGFRELVESIFGWCANAGT
ncbi:ATP-dependent nuclease [Paradevosia shaoguanensis]|uniref:AAA family ATPase n=1 Tax=Paradevosia shaoguanensis TaxID=1335043 RepID=A0AA41UCQ1_9HYPH|nr:AAA family ATPase [Paradevosia shaoguanensis]MCF1742041.1 AAA family ATPase [Paradevosia shaoguanensis]MCI0126524.1 AAA family ATPase [Paradevosia shaoguanensis]